MQLHVTAEADDLEKQGALYLGDPVRAEAIVGTL
jgi:hypothetical protein